MKTIILLLALLSLLPDAQARQLQCQSEDKIDGWNAGSTYELLFLSAGIKGSNLVDPETTGAFMADYSGEMTGKDARSSRWLRFKFLEDAWCWYTLVLPQGFEQQRGGFLGFVDRICEEGHGQMSIRMSCQVR
jgi:hypothetical protein